MVKWWSKSGDIIFVQMVHHTTPAKTACPRQPTAPAQYSTALITSPDANDHTVGTPLEGLWVGCVHVLFSLPQNLCKAAPGFVTYDYELVPNNLSTPCCHVPCICHYCCNFYLIHNKLDPLWCSCRHSMCTMSLSMLRTQISASVSCALPRIMHRDDGLEAVCHDYLLQMASLSGCSK